VLRIVVLTGIGSVKERRREKERKKEKATAEMVKLML
jgi:hypothetical protein